MLPRAALLLALVLTLAGCASPPALHAAHHHAGFALFTGGERIGFLDPAYDLGTLGPAPVHMHTVGTDEEGLWHLEGRFPAGTPDLTLAGILAHFGITFRPGSLALDRSALHDGTTWTDHGPDHAWGVHVSSGKGTQRQPFQAVRGDATLYQPRDGDRVLITYGDADPARLAREQAEVPTPDGPRVLRVAAP